MIGPMIGSMIGSMIWINSWINGWIIDITKASGEASVCVCVCARLLACANQLP